MHLLQAERIIVPLLRQVIGDAARRKGGETEDSILKAFDVAHVETPIWFRGIERASQELDFNHGVDFVVQSDIGKLYLQVKSSNRMADKFRSRQRRPDRHQCGSRYNRYIAVISTEGSKSNEEICLRVFSVVGKKRNKLLAERSQVFGT